MAINVADNFSYLGGKPLDARVKYDTVANMVAVPSANLYDGCLAYVTGTKKNYQYDSSNDTDPTLGKWRELQTGGGTSGGHIIEDSEGTDLTQRDTLQFGEGFLAEDDDTNEKTVISPDVMQSGDMDDVITPLPSVGNKLPVLFDESGTERVVGWYKYANGTKKPVYESNIKIPQSTPTPNQTMTIYLTDIADVEDYVYLGGWFSTNGRTGAYNSIPFSYETSWFARLCGLPSRVSQNQSIMFNYKTTNNNPVEGLAVIRYTKTTDTAE